MLLIEIALHSLHRSRCLFSLSTYMDSFYIALLPLGYISDGLIQKSELTSIQTKPAIVFKLHTPPENYLSRIMQDRRD